MKENMKEIEILGRDRSEPYEEIRVGCRGIVIDGDRLLVSWEEACDWWTLPGGGLESGETLSACCAREILEETGYVAEPIREVLTLNEYYGKYRYIGHYFLCRLVGREKQSLTATERMRNLMPKWIDIRTFTDIVSHYDDYATIDEAKRAAYLREYTAISNWIETVNTEIDHAR